MRGSPKDALGKQSKDVNFVVTLEVTPEQAEQLLVAQAEGDSLRLTLRPFQVGQ
jgi:Flp pilus assembly protein CpaB